jgi:hypothetical protein
MPFDFDKDWIALHFLCFGAHCCGKPTPSFANTMTDEIANIEIGLRGMKDPHFNEEEKE